MRYLIAALLLAACASEPAPAALPPPQTLTGEITRADHQSYREIPFTVPAGASRITIDFAYTGKDARTVIDIGVRDPQGQRGWSGGNKSHIVIGETSATPSYIPGPIQPGEWKLVLGIPNIREGQTATYTATIALDTARDMAKPAIATAWDAADVLSPEAGWYRGDFHAHTAHSDGSCDVGGQRAPCPTHETSDAARESGLDFVAITDHNTMSQLADIAHLQSLNPDLLLIPGTEITTFNGHANVVGNSAFLDFQLGSPRLPSLNKLFDQVDAMGGFISVNHPSLPSGEVCMGCGWTVKDTDWSRVTAIEVINGSTLRATGAEGPLAGIVFWDKLLKQGHRITAIGGSDNHDATDRTGEKQSPIGRPATVVYARELSGNGVIAGVRSGRVYVDAAGLPDTTLEMSAVGNGQVAEMGGEIRHLPGQYATLTVTLTGAPQGAKVGFAAGDVVIEKPVSGRPTNRPDLLNLTATAQLLPGAAHGYIRPEVRSADGKLLLLGNPIYFRPAAS